LSKEDGLAGAIVEELKNQRTVRLGTLITGVSKKQQARPSEVAESIYRLIEVKKVKLEESVVRQSLARRFFSFRNLTFMGLAWVPIVTGLTILGTSLGPLVGDMRILLGSVTVLFLPGFGAIEALYSKKELTGLQTSVYSVALSLVMIPFVGVLLENSAFRINLGSVFASFLVIDLLLLFLASIRRLQSSRETNLGQIDKKAGLVP
jgi:uncharacterized membrane protein